MKADEFGEWLLDEMEAQGITRKRMSELTGMTQTTIRYYINGDRSPSLISACLIAEALGKRIEIT